ncbi:hypothetical protein ACFSR7_24985 [Cohnella sp. GCM10020058]|uniref:hypothetical protein n=1 Tax=Cohnella sp. GCM10020058 TaxID=3317330 RepID=UPI00363D4E1E
MRKLIVGLISIYVMGYLILRLYDQISMTTLNIYAMYAYPLFLVFVLPIQTYVSSKFMNVRLFFKITIELFCLLVLAVFLAWILLWIGLDFYLGSALIEVACIQLVLYFALEKSTNMAFIYLKGRRT